MKYPFVLLFRHNHYSHIDTFFETNKADLLCSITITDKVTNLNRLFNSNNHLLVTYGGENCSEYNAEVHYIISDRMRYRWLHFDTITDVHKFNSAVNYCYMTVVTSPHVKTRPIFSLFTTCYNSYDKIRRAYDSLHVQLLRDWDFDNEKVGTIFDNYPHLNNSTISDTLCYIESDLFRLFILHKYGGFYIDMDVLILRSMLPLNDYEFLYQWGTSGNNNEPFSMNNAIMKLDKGSPLSVEFLELLCKTEIRKNTTQFGNKLFSSTIKNNVLALPCIWFNSEWGFEGTHIDPFKKIENTDFFDGAFTWHWHNKWDDPIEEGSKFQLLEEKHNAMFHQLHG